MNEYEPELKIRDELVDGVAPWMWIAPDSGAWQGPHEEWPHHKEKAEKHVTDWRICVQAGGNQGMYPRLYSEMFDHVYTFEPDPLNFHCLVNNCQKDNIYKMQAALGENTGLAKVNRYTMDNTGMHTVSTEGECFVPMVTIDSLNLPYCGLFQLDLEGYEIYALRGALATIERCKPVIQCECGNDRILELLRPFGYDAVDSSGADTFYKAIW